MKSVLIGLRLVRIENEMPLCPYCDQPMHYDVVIITDAEDGCLGLAHRECVEESKE